MVQLARCSLWWSYAQLSCFLICSGAGCCLSRAWPRRFLGESKWLCIVGAAIAAALMVIVVLIVLVGATVVGRRVRRMVVGRIRVGSRGAISSEVGRGERS